MRVLPFLPVDDPARSGISGPDAHLLRAAGSSSVSFELAAAAFRLGRIHRGQLGEPASWSDPSFASAVLEVVGHLAPLRSRAALLDSLEREAARPEPVLTAYAIAWRNLAPGFAVTTVRRARHRRMSAGLRGRG